MPIETKTERDMQRILVWEVVFILMAIGVDLFLQAIGVGDWTAAAVVLAAFFITGGIYWHLRTTEGLFAKLAEVLRRIFPLRTQADIPLASVTDRPVIHVSDFEKSRDFYARALQPLGYTETMEFPSLLMAAFGINHASDLWIKGDGAEAKIRAAFSATFKKNVDDFYKAALKAGGKDAEAPGSRPERGDGYYAAAVFDPDGYTIEAVHRDPQEA